MPGCTTVLLLRGSHWGLMLGCLCWGAQVGMSALGCSCWGAHVGVLMFGCSCWGAHIGVLMLGDSHWGAHIGVLMLGGSHWGCSHWDAHAGMLTEPSCWGAHIGGAHIGGVLMLGGSNWGIRRPGAAFCQAGVAGCWGGCAGPEGLQPGSHPATSRASQQPAPPPPCCVHALRTAAGGGGTPKIDPAPQIPWDHHLLAYLKQEEKHPVTELFHILLRLWSEQTGWASCSASSPVLTDPARRASLLLK